MLQSASMLQTDRSFGSWHNEPIVITFDNNPGEVFVSNGTITGWGKFRWINGPFDLGILDLVVEWKRASILRKYTVVEADLTPPEIITSSIANGQTDVDPHDVFDNGITIIFSEEISGYGEMQTEDGDDIDWFFSIDNDTITISGIIGKELSNETKYIIVGRVSNAAGKETDVNFTFTTKALD